MHLRRCRALIRRVETGEVLDLARLRLGVESLGVAPHALVDRGVDEDFDEFPGRHQVAHEARDDVPGEHPGAQIELGRDRPYYEGRPAVVFEQGGWGFLVVDIRAPRTDGKRSEWDAPEGFLDLTSRD